MDPPNFMVHGAGRELETLPPGWGTFSTLFGALEGSERKQRGSNWKGVQKLLYYYCRLISKCGLQLRSATQTVIVSSCTARKRAAGKVLCLEDAGWDPTLCVAAQQWLAVLSKAETRRPIRELYASRAFAEARKAADAVAAELFVVSAGLGLAHGDERVPAYDATPTQRNGGLDRLLKRHGASLADWWLALNAGSPLRQMLQARPRATVLLAVPATYLLMLGRDLLSASEQDRGRLRIFTSPAGRRALPTDLQRLALPYDARLEALPGYCGTQSDFCQRALRHFVVSLRGHEVSLRVGQTLVAAALSTLKPRAIAERARYDDEQIRELIRRNWVANKGHSSRLLRFLRDEAHVACEQSRFAKLWRDVRAAKTRQDPFSNGQELHAVQ
jgi:hypothetical protein